MALIKLPVLDPRSTSRAFIKSKSAIAEAAQLSRIADACGAIIKAKRFEPKTIAELAQRQNYPVAFNVLARIANLDEAALAALIDPAAATAVAAFRAARAFRVIVREDEATAFGIDDLHAVGTEAAACALAACGIIDWKREKRQRPRAVFVLRALIEARRS